MLPWRIYELTGTIPHSFIPVLHEISFNIVKCRLTAACRWKWHSWAMLAEMMTTTRPERREHAAVRNKTCKATDLWLKRRRTNWRSQIRPLFGKNRVLLFKCCTCLFPRLIATRGSKWFRFKNLRKANPKTTSKTAYTNVPWKISPTTRDTLINTFYPSWL